MTDPENDTVARLLEGLKPSAPSDALMRRLSAARPVLRVPTRREKVIAFIPRFAMAAASVALASALAWKFMPRGAEADTVADHPTATTPPAGTATVAALLPLQSRQRLLGVQDLGVTRDGSEGAVRLIRARWLDDETITLPGGAPPVRQERVRDEIVPLSVSTF